MGNLHIHKGNLAGIHSGHTDKGMNVADLSLGGHLVFLPVYEATPPQLLIHRRLSGNSFSGPDETEASRVVPQMQRGISPPVMSSNTLAFHFHFVSSCLACKMRTWELSPLAALFSPSV